MDATLSVDGDAASPRRRLQAVARTVHRVGHEMRNALNALHINGHLLLQSELSPDQRRLARGNGDAIADLDGLVDLLVDLVDVRAGETELDRRPVSIADLLGETTAALRPVLEREIRVRADTEDLDAPVDAERVRQALETLISTVFGARDDAPVSVRASTENGDRGNLTITIRGEGAQERALAEALAGGAVGEALRTRAGLRLSHARALIELHGGSLAAKTEGSAAELRVRLPRSA